jgi:transposase
MLDMLKRHEIQVLRKAGHSQGDTAKLAGVGERTVRRVEAEPAVASVDGAAERERRQIGRPPKADGFGPWILETLRQEPQLLTLELLRRARLAGYEGGKSAFYALVAGVRPSTVRPMTRFEGLPAEFCQHDFGHVDVRWIGGGSERVHFFASRLKYSRWAEVSLVDDEKVETLVRTQIDHYAAMGGVALLAVFDRPKTVALAWRNDGEVTEWNPTFGAAMLELGVGVEVCWPARGNQKGAVENLVGWVKGSFFKQRRFVDHEDLRGQLAEWRRETNTERPSRATGVIPAERMVEERARLRPLKVQPQDLALRIPIQVSPTATVLHDTHRYSMPPEAIGLTGTLYLYRDRVRIVASRYEASHRRLFERDAVSQLPEHRAAMIAAVSGKRGKRYLKRQHLLELGPAALAYLTELVHRRPYAWAHDVDRLHDLLQAYGPERLRAAFERAMVRRTIGAEYVAHDLEQPLQTELGL